MFKTQKESNYSQKSSNEMPSEKNPGDGKVLCIQNYTIVIFVHHKQIRVAH